jgi:hypothetical protein
MKIRFLYFRIFFLYFNFTYSQAPSDTAKSNIRDIISINPLQLFFGELRVEYEKPQKKKSFVFGAGLIYLVFPYELYGYYGGDIPNPFFVVGMQLRSGMKFYTSNIHSNEGFYFYPLCFAKYVYHHENYQNTNYTETHSTIGLQLLIGFKFHSESKISYNIYGGCGGRLIYGNYFTDSIHESDKNQLYSPQLGFTIGYILKNK